MKLSKRHLKRIIREEKSRLRRLYKRRIAECPGDDMDMGCGVGDMDMGMAVMAPENGIVSESGYDEAVGEVLVEMGMAARHLKLVVESLENAETLLEHCDDPVACHQPLVESLAGQVDALRATVEAETHVLKENAELNGNGNGSGLPI